MTTSFSIVRTCHCIVMVVDMESPMWLCVLVCVYVGRILPDDIKVGSLTQAVSSTTSTLLFSQY